MNIMNYMGFTARIEYSEEDECFIGHIAGIQDVVGFHGESVSDIKSAFKEAVDDYIATCEKLRRSPPKPYSGKFMLHIDPTLHAKVTMLAEAQGKSLNAWAQEIFAQAANKLDLIS